MEQHLVLVPGLQEPRTSLPITSLVLDDHHAQVIHLEVRDPPVVALSVRDQHHNPNIQILYQHLDLTQEVDLIVCIVMKFVTNPFLIKALSNTRIGTM